MAELSAAFGCASLGIVPTVRHADYIGAWLEVLREDNRAIVRLRKPARPRTTCSASFPIQRHAPRRVLLLVNARWREARPVAARGE